MPVNETDQKPADEDTRTPPPGSGVDESSEPSPEPEA
jgi:hypothetical protein